MTTSRRSAYHSGRSAQALLDAIARFNRVDAVCARSRSPILDCTIDHTEVSAERRPITVMFCDLVGSTSLAAKLDAEDWRNLVNAYLDEASAAVTDFGGHVLKRLGDGLMALFGYPHAQENDAERAVRAALAIQRALVEINARNASQAARRSCPRASALIPGRWSWTPRGEVFGDAPNIAARVQSRRRARVDPHHSHSPAADRGTVRGRGPRPTRTQGGVCAHDALSRRSRERRRPARRRARSNPARRARGGARSSHPALGARAQGRGPTRARSSASLASASRG